MPAILLAVLLMSFLLWSYKSLNKTFSSSPESTTMGEKITALRENFSLKQLLIITLLFLGCYFFVNAAIKYAENSRPYPEQREPVRFTQADIERMQNEQEQKKAESDKDSGIKLLKPDQVKTKFTDIAGLHEAKDEMEDIIQFLRNPVYFKRLGAKPPKGVLLFGEPGTGKTLMARAIAGEAGVSFIAVSGSEFDEEYVGVGAARVRKLFNMARKNAPCIIFIDEIDALAYRRNSRAQAWAVQTTNQLLSEMDGLDELANEGIVIIGASNRLDAIDPAVLRPGRLDRHIKLDLPTRSEREEILKLYLNKITTDKDVSSALLAGITTGFSSAELANLVNEAAIIATKENLEVVDMLSFDRAKDRIVMGSTRKALKMTEEERRITAYHEAGHALVGHLLEESHPDIYKVTITPRGLSLGHTSFEPKQDEYSLSLRQIEARIATQLAGRVAEELLLGEQDVTTGAESDLVNATQLAKNMVTRWGYSKDLGPVYYGDAENFPKDIVEKEVKEILERNYERSRKILNDNRDKLDKLALTLLERETIDGKELKQLLRS